MEISLPDLLAVARVVAIGFVTGAVIAIAKRIFSWF